MIRREFTTGVGPCGLVGLPLLLLAAACTTTRQPVVPAARVDAFTYDHDGITRGDRSRRELALVFTADVHGEGTQHVLDVLARRGTPASFFLTGNYLRDERYRPFVPRMVREGHCVGPHSDAHLLYAPWDDRERSLVRRGEFVEDLSRNIHELRRLGALSQIADCRFPIADCEDGGNGRKSETGNWKSTMSRPIYFIPPYEWYNRDHVAWARDLGVQMVNFTPGIGSNRDYMSESDPKFRPSRRILEDILAFEQRDPHGLSGVILLLHLGADRRDKMYLLLDPLLDELTRRGYRLQRIDTLLAPGAPPLATTTAPVRQ